MARRPRHYLPGAIYHVILRGNNRQPIFSTDGERCRMCMLIQEGVERFEHQVIAFCFMTNHIHLAIRVNEVPLSPIMQNLAFRYTRSFNRRHDRVGHLFQGRFSSVLVDSRSYMRELVRYIHLNPVHAGIVDKPQDYTWSSHRAYLQKQSIAWLSPQPCLENFGQSPETEVQHFHTYVMAGIGLDEAIDFDKGNANGILGGKAFVKTVTTHAQPESDASVDLKTLVSVVAQHYQVEATELQTPRRDARSAHIRATAALLARTVGIPVKDVADFFGRNQSAICNSTRRLEQKLHKSSSLRSEIDGLHQALLLQSLPDGQ